MQLRDWREVAVGTLRAFVRDGALSLAAAIAFYSVLSLAPVALLLVSAGGLVWDDAAVRSEIVAQSERLAGPAGSKIVETVLRNASRPGGGWMAAVGGALVLFAATTVFAQIQYALNRVWGVRSRPGIRVWPLIRARIISLGIIVTVGLLLLTSLIASSVVSFLETKLTESTLPGGTVLWRIASFGASLVVFAVLFGMLFRMLPDVRVAWRDVAIGAILTAVLFAIGKELVGLYLGRSSFTSAYGAAGSLVALLAWVYYVSILLLVGAEFTQAYARNRGRRITPKPWADRISESAGKALRSSP